MSVRSRGSEAILLYSDLAQTVNSCMGAPRRSPGFHLASRSMAVAEVNFIFAPLRDLLVYRTVLKHGVRLNNHVHNRGFGGDGLLREFRGRLITRPNRVE